MKLNGLGNTGSPAATARSGDAKPARSEPASGSSEQVRLSPTSTELAANGAEPVVDSARVQEIRLAISQGRFQINAGAIADSLIATARELVDSQRKA